MRLAGEVAGPRCGLLHQTRGQPAAGRGRPRGRAGSLEVRAADDGRVYLGKGRFINDDPKKYPGKEDIGPFSGVTGGWAGGEVALKESLDAYTKKDLEALVERPSKTVTVPATGKAAPLVAEKGQDLIYIGFGKDEADFAARQLGQPGKFVKDDARKYPGKESIGPLANVAGGFPGGELGVQQFAATGDIELLPEGARPRQRQSPLFIGLAFALVGTIGALSVEEGAEVAESGLERIEGFAGAGAGVASGLAAVDGSTKLLLEVAVITLAVVATLAGVRVGLSRVASGVSESLASLGKLTVFWIVVFLAARFVLET